MIIFNLLVLSFLSVSMFLGSVDDHKMSQKLQSWIILYAS